MVGSTRVPKNEKLGSLMPDGLHFSAEGNKLCFQLVFQKIKEVYPEMDPEKIEPNVPLFDSYEDILGKVKAYRQSRLD